MSSIGNFGASDYQTIRFRMFFVGNRVVKAFEASEVAEAAEVNEVSKAWKISNEVFKGTLVLEFNNLISHVEL